MSGTENGNDLRAIVVVARERSGSTVLQRYFSSSDEFEPVYEVWNFADNRDEFYRFWLKELESEPRLIRPNRRAEVFERYLRFKSEGGSKTLVFDQKYGHLDMLNYVFNPRFDEQGRPKLMAPETLRFLMRHRFHIVHLIRRNKLRIFVSWEQALQNDKWHVNSEPTEPSRPIEIDTQEMTEFVRYSQSISSLVDSFLKGYDLSITAHYEDLFDEAGEYLLPQWHERFSKFLGAPSSAFNPKLSLARSNPFPLSELIANYEKVAAVLAGSEFEWMLDDKR